VVRDWHLLPYMVRKSLLLLLLIGCSGKEAAVASGDEADLTSVPADVTRAAFFFKPNPIDQSGLGIVLADGVAFAAGATSEALPEATTLDHEPMIDLRGKIVTVRGERFGAFVDKPSHPADPTKERLFGRTAPARFSGTLTVGTSCTVVGTDMDMYSSGPPALITLSGAVTQVRGTHVIVTTTKSTGGEGSLLVCGNALAGVEAGAGSQGTTFEFRVLDDEFLAAFARLR